MTCMGYEAVAWVLVYIAAFGVSDTMVAVVQPTPEWTLVYYTCIGLVGARMLIKRSTTTNNDVAERNEPAAAL